MDNYDESAGQYIMISSSPQTYFIRVYLEKGTSNRYDMLITIDGISEPFVPIEPPSPSLATSLLLPSTTTMIIITVMSLLLLLIDGN